MLKRDELDAKPQGATLPAHAPWSAPTLRVIAARDAEIGNTLTHPDGPTTMS